MKIESVEALVTCPGRNFVLVKVVTDSGLVGWGDATLNGRELAVSAYLDEHIAPLLMGEDPGRIEHLWQSWYVGAYWRGGPVQNTALAGVDMALWDILGKACGVPVHQLLGGRVRDRVLAYTHVQGVTAEDAIAGVKRRAAAGFQVLRIQQEAAPGATYGEQPARPPASAAEKQAGEPVDRTAALLDQRALPAVGRWEPTPYMRALPKFFGAVRAGVGDEIELLHDVHQRLSPIQAADLAREIQEFHPFFFEDPVAPEYKEGLALIRQNSTVPIAIGELFTDISECLPVVTNRWADFMRCDLGHLGGITPARKLAALCEPFGIRTAWHGPPDLSPVGHAANVHVDLSVSNFGVQEWTEHRPATLAKLREVFQGGVTLREGHLDVPDAPGLGVEINEAAARKYAYRRAYLPTVRRADGSVHPW